MYSSCWLLAPSLATRFCGTVGGETLICPCSWDWQVSLCPVWDVSDRYFAADEMRMQKFESASGISLVICGQRKGRARWYANASLAGVALLQAAADSHHFKQYLYYEAFSHTHTGWYCVLCFLGCYCLGNFFWGDCVGQLFWFGFFFPSVTYI